MGISSLLNSLNKPIQKKCEARNKRVNKICKNCTKKIIANSSYNKGVCTNVAFVFSCPGSFEEKYGQPACAGTGTRLEKVLQELHSTHSVLRNLCRYDFRIVNAYDKPLYKAKNGKSEWDDSDIVSKNNICRLFGDLKDIIKSGGIIICFGDKAELAIRTLKSCPSVRKLTTRVQYLKTCHTSPTVAGRHGITPQCIAKDINAKMKSKGIKIPTCKSKKS